MSTRSTIEAFLDEHTAHCKKAIDLGCGERPYAEKIHCNCRGLDVNRKVKPDLTADFNEPLPLPDECADFVFSINTINYVREKKLFAREMHRILRRKGSCLVGCMNFFVPHNSRFDTMTVFGLWRLLKEAGFKRIRPIDFVHAGFGGTVLLYAEK
ncbi:MAG: methyltransferase domain-containing protein [Candidatus Micrarchaeia archaeon]